MLRFMYTYLYNFNFLNLKFTSINYSLLTHIILFIKREVSEKYFRILNFLINYQLTSWKQYLKEKFRTKKEKLARAKTWARKHEGKLSTMKGFYIPPQLPETDQAKFFLKKREEDEQVLRDKELLLTDENKNKIKTNVNQANLEPVTGDLKKHSIKLSLISKWNNLEFFNVTHFNFFTISKTKSIKKNSESKNFFFWFSKNFLRTPFPPIKLREDQHIWSFLNLGFDTSDFLNFFFIHYFPIFLVNFSFLKNKVLLTKRFWNIFQLQSSDLALSLKANLTLKNNYFSMLKVASKKSSFLILNKKTFKKLFNFLNVFKNWGETYYFSFFFKNFFLNYLERTNSLFIKLIKYFFSILKKYFIFEDEIKKDLLLILFSWLFGSIDYNIVKTKNWRKNLYLTFFNYYIPEEVNVNLLKNYLNFFTNYNFCVTNTLPTFNFFFFLEFFFTKFSSFIFQKIQLDRTSLQIFFEKLTQHGYSTINHSFFASKKLSKTFFVFLRNRVKYYENIRFLFHSSITQNLKVIDEFNVARILFRYIIRKGEKLTARRVFFKFLKNFKKNYALPPLMIFAHALLYVEPKIWLKEKKIAGKVYQIPIYISPKRSKSIAIRWLLQAAKKRQTASITESLAQEVWDACFKWGVAYNNKETLLATAKKNKAYLRWF